MLVAVYASVFHTYAWVWVRLCQGNAAFLIPNIRDGILMHTGEWPGWAPPEVMPNSEGKLPQLRCTPTEAPVTALFVRLCSNGCLCLRMHGLCFYVCLDIAWLLSGCIHSWPESIKEVWQTLVSLGVDVRPNTDGKLPYPYKPQGLLSIQLMD